MPVITDTYAKRIGNAVKAELARKGRSTASLVETLGLSRNSIYSRTRGDMPFDYVELQLIADSLEIDLSQLIESAELFERKAS